MSIRVAGQALKIVAFAGLALGSASLAGCTTLGGAAFGDVTGSTGQSASAVGTQAMPAALKPVAQSTQVAVGPYIPPEDISGGGSGGLVTGSAPTRSVTTSALPPLQGSSTMSAQPSLATVPTPKTASLGTLPVNSSQPILAVDNTGPAGGNVYTHIIESGESLYTIARRYDVTAQAIMQANKISSPEKIYVGQKIIIPGRADLLAAKAAPSQATAKVASITPEQQTAPTPAHALAPTGVTAKTDAAAAPQKTAAIPDPKLVDPSTSATQPPAQTKVAAVEPVMSGADKFRWPVSGKVITDFIASKGTGINIDAPAGTAVRAAENGTVIYVGSGVEGYGNLVLIRHPNGFVSAYAHLDSTSVTKGQTVSRGDSIGQVGMTGSVSRPQLHFELRKGATPVDPIPLLAG